MSTRVALGVFIAALLVALGVVLRHRPVGETPQLVSQTAQKPETAGERRVGQPSMVHPAPRVAGSSAPRSPAVTPSHSERSADRAAAERPGGQDVKDGSAVAASGLEAVPRPLPRGDHRGGAPAADAIDGAAETAGLPSGTRFAAPLSGSTQSIDGTEPLVESNIEHEIDAGVYFPPDAQLAYPDRSGVQGGAGTVALWVEPVDWTGDDASVHSLFRINDPAELGYRFHLLKDSGNLRFQFITEQGESNVRVPIEWWPRGEMHHVAATWSGDTLRLYIDGVPYGEQAYEGAGGARCGARLVGVEHQRRHAGRRGHPDGHAGDRSAARRGRAAASVRHRLRCRAPAVRRSQSSATPSR